MLYLVAMLRELGREPAATRFAFVGERVAPGVWL
jgi:hypothetical protein